MNEALRLEVQELTELLQADASLGAVRHWLAAHGLRVKGVRLAGLIDNADGVVADGDGLSIGVLVTASGEIIEFEGETTAGREPLRWERVSSSDARARWPAAGEALDW